jgi:hypothetical protein
MEQQEMFAKEAPDWFEMEFTEEEIDQQLERILPLGVL